MKELGIPELNSEQIEELCTITEEAARKYVLSKVPSKEIEALDISVEAKGMNPVKLAVDVDFALYSQTSALNAHKLANEAVKKAFVVAEKYLRGLTCRSQK